MATLLHMRGKSEIHQYATEVLGPIHPSADLTRRAGRVVAVTDREGTDWVVKTVPSRVEFDCEVTAYTEWVPRFADQAPRLRHAEPRLKTIILERLPGYADWSFSPADHVEAGRLLRRIHEAATPRSDGPSVGEATADKLAVALRGLPGPGIVGADELAFACAGVRTLNDSFGHLTRVPCHGDFGGHNWLRGGDRMSVIDFSSARLNAAAADFARLFIGPWWERPDLADAFFDGYGRAITEEEVECVRLQLPAFAIRLVGLGTKHADAEMEHRGRYRLHKLMGGADFTTWPTGLRRPFHAVRRVAKSWPTPGRPAVVRRGAEVSDRPTNG